MPTSSFKIAAALPLLTLAACMGERAGLSPAYAPSYAPPPPPVASSNGAIFQAARGYAPLTSGARAASVGDILTIALVERTDAVKSTSASTDRASDFGITPPSTGPLSFFQPTDISTGGELSFNGEGEASQSNRLFGEISVTVAEVYPNGTMLVKGQKQVNINRGDEFIQVSGLVRAADIGPDNRVPSTRVADARITYSGRGEIARASRQGWLQRFFTAVSPF